jgi:transposase
VSARRQDGIVPPGEKLGYKRGSRPLGNLCDGRFAIDNNLVENALRPTAVGPKRWLFLGHPEAGWHSAVIYSMIGSCRQRGLNPQEYPTDVLRRLPGLTTHQLEPLLPGNWKRPTLNSS